MLHFRRWVFAAPHWPHPSSVFLQDWEPSPQSQWQLGRELTGENFISFVPLKVIINGKLPYLKVIMSNYNIHT